MKTVRILVLLLNCILLPAQTLNFSRIFSGHQKNSPLHLLNTHESHFFLLRYNRALHDLILEKRAKPSAELLRIYPLKMDSVNAHWFDYEQLDYVLFEAQSQLYFIFEKVLNNERALFMRVLDSTGRLSGFIPVYSQKSNPGATLKFTFSCDSRHRLQIISETNSNHEMLRKTILLYDPAQRQLISRFLLPLENAFSGYSRAHVISAEGDLYYLQTYQEITGYERHYTTVGNVSVPKLQTDSLTLVRISQAQVLTKQNLLAPSLTQIHFTKIIPAGPQVFFLLHASALDSLPFFYLSRQSADLQRVDFIHTEALQKAACKMLRYYDGSDDASPGGKVFREAAFSERNGKVVIWEERVEGNYHREILMWQADLERGQLTSQQLIPRKLFFFPNRTYFRQLNQLILLQDSGKQQCFLLENRSNKRQGPADYHHRRFEKQTLLRHGALVEYQSERQELRKRLLFENNDFDFVPLRYSGWERDVVFYFNSGKNERFAILTNCRF